MSLASIILLSLAMVLGLLVAMLLTIPGEAEQQFAARLGYVHGTLGAAGFAALVIAGASPAYGGALATTIAFAVALAIGIGIFLAYRTGRKPSPIVIALHASAALLGFSFLTGAL